MACTATDARLQRPGLPSRPALLLAASALPRGTGPAALLVTLRCAMLCHAWGLPCAVCVVSARWSTAAADASVRCLWTWAAFAPWGAGGDRELGTAGCWLSHSAAGAVWGPGRGARGVPKGMALGERAVNEAAREGVGSSEQWRLSPCSGPGR